MRRKVLLTGASGFVGQNLLPRLRKGYRVYAPNSKNFDLRKTSACKKVVKGMDYVIHLAGNVGGIGYNQRFPAQLFYDNAIMGINLIHEAYKAGVRKMVVIGTVCAYPKYTKVPFREINLWDGYPEDTNAPYGLAKKMLLVQAQAYRKQYKFNCIYLLPVNMYGPHDNFDPHSSHVIPALIEKFIDAKERKDNYVYVWGTGKATRQFLYVDDFADAVIAALEKYDGEEPINIGSGEEISIANLAELIAKLVGFKGDIRYDSSLPDGQPRRYLDTTRAKEYFGFKAKTNFKRGLRKTIESYKNVR